MDKVTEIADLIVWLLRAGVGFRLAFCLMRMIGNEEDAASYKKRALHVVVFYVLAESIWQIKELVLHYLN